MGKVVKYCASCEESFAEKFSFCPNCAAGLSAYELNPVMPMPKAPEPAKIFEPAPEPVKIFEPAPEIVAEKVEMPTVAFETVSFEKEFEPVTPSFLSEPTDDILEIKEETAAEFSSPPAPLLPTVPAVPAYSFESSQPTFKTQQFLEESPSAPTANYRSQEPQPAPKKVDIFVPKNTPKKVDNNGYYNVTFVQPKGDGTRNLLLLGAAMLVFSFSFGFLIYSIFTNDAYVTALDDSFNDVVSIAEPVATEPDPPEPKNKDKDDGGGGGGGKNQEVETSKGRLAPQVEKPMMSPSVTMDQVTKPSIPIQMATEGKKEVPPSEEKYGNPNSRNINLSSDGTGSGGGQGAGEGTGQGNGRGTGQGNGIGSGSGNGNGSGNGDGSGRGSGDEDDRNAPPPIKVGPTEGIKILGKPRPSYTDAARTNQVTGTVTLRVTFLANGSVGSISTVSGLPHGLTEQAIAAARGIRFEPAKKNGVPYAVTKQVQFNFTLY